MNNTTRAALQVILEEIQPDKFFALPDQRKMSDIRWAIARICELLLEEENE